MIIEYLIVTKQEEGFCNSKEAFVNLLQSDTHIVINKDKLKFRQGVKTLEIDFQIETNEIKDKKQRYFHIKLICKEDSKILELTQITRIIKRIASKINVGNSSISTLWDDISIHYATQSYPLVNEIENLMRKLIQKFMIINVGMDWTTFAMPTDVKKKISNKENRNAENNTTQLLEDTLHNADFIVLSDFLFEKYRNKEIGQLDNLVSSKSPDSSITFEEIKRDFFPMSNWDRFFSGLINYESEVLKSQWSKLYDLRNKVAHNKTIEKKDFEEIKKLVTAIKSKLTEAINSLDKLELSEEQKESVIVSYQPISSVQGYLVEQAVVEWYKNSFPSQRIDWLGMTPHDSGIDIVITLNNEKKIGVQVKGGTAMSLKQIRNQVAHAQMDRLIPVNFMDFDEFHLVFAVRDFESFDPSVSFATELTRLLTSLNPRLKLIIGFIDENRQFVEYEEIK